MPSSSSSRSQALHQLNNFSVATTVQHVNVIVLVPVMKEERLPSRGTRGVEDAATHTSEDVGKILPVS
eukprot:scaffold498_cov118-Skeletonema_menzelii.AAC.3